MLKSTCVRCSVGQKEIYGGQFQNEKTHLASHRRAYGIRAFARTVGPGDTMLPPTHPTDTAIPNPPRILLIHFADSAIFITTQNSWAGLTAGSQWRPAIRKAQASYPTLRKAVTLPVNFTTATFTAIAMRRKAITTSGKVNAFTFEETILGTSEAVAADMAYDYSTDTMYAVSGDLLCTVNLSDGSLTEVGFVGPDAMLALACSTDGQLYGIGDDCNLYAIEKTEGWGEVCGFTASLRTDFIHGWDHNTDTLYWASCATTPHLFTYYTTMGNLCELNTIDGTATVIGNIYGSKSRSPACTPFPISTMRPNSRSRICTLALTLHTWYPDRPHSFPHIWNPQMQSAESHGQRQTPT